MMMTIIKKTYSELALLLKDLSPGGTLYRPHHFKRLPYKVSMTPLLGSVCYLTLGLESEHKTSKYQRNFQVLPLEIGTSI